jgi:hypothetical protein
MKKEIRKWARVLRSGKYKQTTGALQDSTGFCCLGVACDIFIPKRKQKTYPSGHLFGGTPNGQPNAPEWLKQMDDRFITDTEEALTILNDDQTFTFDEIADVLEAVYIHDVLKESA